MSTLARILCLFAAFAVIEGHLLVSQSLAWLAMIHERAPEMGVPAAVADTFSGSNPCHRCTAIQAERERHKEEAPLPESSSLAKAAPILIRHLALKVTAPLGISHPRPTSDRVTDFWQTEVPSPPPWLG